jgi:hypothetical protein
MGSIRNRDRTPVFPLITIDLEKSKGKWRILVGDRRIGKLYSCKVFAMRDIRKIRKAWAKSSVEVFTTERGLLQSIQNRFCEIAGAITGQD